MLNTLKLHRNHLLYLPSPVMRHLGLSKEGGEVHAVWCNGAVILFSDDLMTEAGGSIESAANKVGLDLNRGGASPIEETIRPTRYNVDKRFFWVCANGNIGKYRATNIKNNIKALLQLDEAYICEVGNLEWCPLKDPSTLDTLFNFKAQGTSDETQSATDEGAQDSLRDQSQAPVDGEHASPRP